VLFAVRAGHDFALLQRKLARILTDLVQEPSRAPARRKIAVENKPMKVIRVDGVASRAPLNFPCYPEYR
jgi:hypothetical protein